MQRFRAVLLVGHGGTAKDMPRDLVTRQRKLAREREQRGDDRTSAEEATLDRQIREWPRTPDNDPYKAGLESIAARLAPRIDPLRLAVAYNEFCAPSPEAAIDDLVSSGADSVLVVSTMFTPGGGHSEIDLPELVRAACARHPYVDIRYAWPFALDGIAEFLALHIEAHDHQPR